MKVFSFLNLTSFVVLMKKESVFAKQCVDDSEYRNEDHPKQKCGWIRRDESRRRSLCQQTEVQTNCPFTCGICCEDRKIYRLRTNEGDKNCWWVGKSENRKTRWCNTFNNKSNVRLACPDTYCTNNPNYAYNGNENRDCIWIKNQSYNFCSQTDVVENCPVICGVCCEDDPNYTFDNNKTCEWLSKRNKSMINKLCPQLKNGIKVQNACLKTCGTCPDTTLNPIDSPNSSSPTNFETTNPTGNPSSSETDSPTSSSTTLFPTSSSTISFPTSIKECDDQTGRPCEDTVESCPSGKSSLNVFLQADEKSEKENDYQIFVQNKRGEWKVIETVDSFRNGEPHTYHKCLNNDKCYKLQMNDSGYNGLCCDHGDGYYKIIYDGDELEHSTANNANAPRSETTIFGDCRCNKKKYTFDRYAIQKCPEICGGDNEEFLYNGSCKGKEKFQHRSDRWKWVSCAPKKDFPSSFNFFSQWVGNKDWVCYSYSQEEGALIQFLIRNFKSYRFQTKEKGYVMRGSYRKIAGPGASVTHSQRALERSCYLAYTYSGLDEDRLLSHWEDCTKARYSLTGRNRNETVAPTEARFNYVRDGILVPNNTGLLFTDKKNVRFLDFDKNEIRNLLLVEPEKRLNTIGFGSEVSNPDTVASKFFLGGETGLSRNLNSTVFDFLKHQSIKQLAVSPNGCYVIACSGNRASSPLLFDLCEDPTNPKEVQFNTTGPFKECYAVTFASNQEAILVNARMNQSLSWGVLNIEEKKLNVNIDQDSVDGCIPNRFKGYGNGHYPSQPYFTSFGIHGMSNVIHTFNRKYTILALTYEDGFCMCELDKNLFPEQCEFLYPNLAI